jgi:hypothetical protein
MVLGLFYDALSTAVFMWHQEHETVIITDEWKDEEGSGCSLFQGTIPAFT